MVWSKTKAIHGLLLVLLLSGVGTATALEVGPLLDRARSLLATGDAQAAATLLDAVLTDFAGNPQYDALLGQALYASGHSSDAAFAYERVLMVTPGNNDARLKLARIAAENNDLPLARETLSQLDEHAPDSAQLREAEAVRQLISERSAEHKLIWQGYVQAGFGWDSNATVGPDADALLIPGVDATTPTNLLNSRSDGDSLQTIEAGGALRTALGGQSWLLGGGNLHQGHYDTRSALREGYLNLYLGVARQWHDNLFSATALGQDYRVGDRLYRSLWGGRFGWLRAVSGDSRLSATYQYSDYHYPELTGEDAVHQEARLSHEINPGHGRVFQYGVQAGIESTKLGSSSQLGYHLWGVHAGAEANATERLTLASGMVFEARDYSAVDPLYLYVRRDRQWSIGASADYLLAEHLHLSSQITYVRNISNMGLFDYTRSTYMLLLRWEFGNEP